MADTEKKTAKKSNTGVIIAIIIAVVAIAGVIAAIVLLGGNNGSDGGSAKSPIVGVWKYKGMDAKYVFNDDGTCSYDYYNSSQKCTYTDNGDSVELLYEGMTVSNKFGYRIDGKTLYIEDSFGDEVEYEKQ